MKSRSDVQHRESFLSDEIRALLVIKSSDPVDKSLNFDSEVGVIDWPKVEQYFAGEIVPHDQPLSYEFCKSFTPKLHRFIQTFTEATVSPEHLQWTNRSELIQQACSSLHHHVSNLLILTATAEYSLGNLYQTETKTVPPHLLRDLLMTDALAGLLGEPLIFLLRVVMGTPNGINLRNLLWHGFPEEDEVSECYRNLLVKVLASIGSRLSDLRYEVEFRKCAQDTRELVREMNLKRFDVELLQPIDGWSEILNFYSSGEFYRCACLTLSRLEMFLRKVYGAMYGRDYRAKLDEYYIIMDTVFEEFASEGRRNGIHGYFSASLLEVVYDLLAAVNGPRLRDKLSHGELRVEDVDEGVANALLLVSEALMSRREDLEYRSVFHPNAVLAGKIREGEAVLHRCWNVELPEEMRVDWEINYEVIPFLPEMDSFEEIQIFYRPAKEEEIVGLLHRIMANLLLAAENLLESLAIRLEALEKRELRSRARSTLASMLQMLPEVVQALQFVLSLVKWIFHCLMNTANDELRDELKLIRFLRRALKYAENAANNLNARSNAWRPLLEATRRELYDKTSQNLTLLLC